MSKEAKEEITSQLFGITPVLINSALVSAQNRKRLFWVGRRNEDGTYSKVEVPQPEDKGIVLKDILEDIPLTDERWKPLDEKYVGKVNERLKALALTATYANVVPKNHIKCDSTVIVKDKSYGVTATYAGACPRDDFEKSNRTVILGQYRRTDLRIHADQENSPTLTANMGTGGNNVPVLIGSVGTNSQGNRIYSTDSKAVTVNSQTG